MNDAHDPPPADRAEGTGRWLDQVADRFEAAWKAGPEPRIADFAAGESGPRRAELLEELIRLDFEYRCRAGRPRPAREYLAEFPELSPAGPTPPGGLAAHLRRLCAAYGLPASDWGLDAAPPPDAPPAIGPYRVLKKLGRGGQADVYRAFDPATNRDVVVKWNRHRAGELPNNTEAAALAALDHPNLVRVHAAGVHDQRPYVVMDYVPGRGLDQVAADRPMTPGQVAATVAAIARAVDAAHAKGIFHQDLKPANVLIDESDRPRVIDFGLASVRRFWADAADQPAGLTPAFAAPEQARGAAEPAGPRTDVFGLGGLLYYLLAGQAPFAAADGAKALARAARCDIDWSRLAAAPARLTAVCRRATAANPADRYPTAAAMADDLERPPGPAGGWLWALTALALAALAAAVVWWLGRVPEPTTPKDWHLVEAVLRPADRGKVFPIKINDLSDLQRLMPVRPKDRIRLWYPVPKGYRAAAFRWRQGRKADELTPVKAPGDGPPETARFWAEPLPADGRAAGWEVLLLVATPVGGPALGAADVDAAVKDSNIEAAPALESNVVFYLTVEGHRFEGEKPRGTRGVDAFDQVEDGIARLGEVLRRRGVYAWAVLLPYGLGDE